MGLKLQGVIRCGHCRKPRGIRHTCVTRIGSRSRRHKVQAPVTWECSGCGKPRGLRHTCGNRGDFKRRKRKQATADRRAKRKAVTAKRAARRKQVAAERRTRDRARKQAARTRTRSPRPRGERHDPGSCGDRDCQKYACIAYRQGMADCPGPHEGG